MPTFRTELILPRAPFQWGMGNPVLTVGSCFAELMGRQLAENKLPVLINPFGILFNPVSIGKLITGAVHNTPLADAWVERQGTWFHYDFHSRFAANQHEALQQQLERAMASTHRFLQRTDVLLLTFGTAWVYTLKATGEVVANCHKVPAGQFERRLLSLREITEAFKRCYLALKELRAPLQIILTVSPVRHTKDTLPLNQVSKSTLRVACHELAQSLPDVHYFPSYELMMDDLRDYRFYQPDMIHPSEVAEAYIWQKFSEAYLTPEAKDFIGEWTEVRKAMAHRPFQPDAMAHRHFLERTLQRLEKLSQQADMSAEIAEVRNRLLP